MVSEGSCGKVTHTKYPAERYLPIPHEDQMHFCDWQAIDEWFIRRDSYSGSDFKRESAHGVGKYSLECSDAGCTKEDQTHIVCERCTSIARSTGCPSRVWEEECQAREWHEISLREGSNRRL